MGIRITSVRTAIAALAVGCGVFAASGPMAATAFSETNTGGGPSGESAQCTALWNSFESNVNTAGNAYNKGDTQTFNSALGAARQNVSDARAAGCDWAASVALPSPTPIVVRTPITLAR